MNKKYYYGMKSRGFAPGCQPMDGFIERLDSDSDEFYDIIVYEKPLTEDDEMHYTLIPLNACIITDNLGDDSISFFKDYKDAHDHVRSTLLFAYEEYCKTYPDCNTTWDNSYLLFGDESEVYVPSSDCYTKAVIYSPIERIKRYIKKNHYPERFGDFEYVLCGVNAHEDADTDEMFPISECVDKYLSFRDRYNRAKEEIEKLTRGKTLEETKAYFEANATGNEGYFYGKYFYIYTKKKSPRYIAYGIRMDSQLPRT